jgi:hypothetical protein
MGRFKASAIGQQLFAMSPVTLGFGRIALALLLIGDAARRWTDLDVWYTNAGLMPNHTMLWAPQMRYGFSVFFSVSQLHEARFFVLLFIAVYFGLLVGWRTKLMQILALLAHVSLDCRVHYLTNGGDVALSVLLLWTCFLPLGEWLSVDAMRKGVRAPPPKRFDWAMGGLCAQLAVIYFFNYVHKDGAGWHQGRVIIDVFNQNRIATPLAVWIRPYVTYDLSVWMTRSVLAAEASLPFLVLLPVHSLWVRRAACFIGFSLHAGFALFINLGVFSETMMLFWLFLVPHEDSLRFAQWLLGRRLLSRPNVPPARATKTWVEELRLLLLSWVALAFVVQTLAQNRAVPPSLKPDPPFPVQVVVEYLHFFQGWGMFAESPREDWTVVVRAVTADGRLVDPLSERSSPRSPVGMTAITGALDHDEFWCDYLSRISDDGRYHGALKDWILNYPQRTGNPNDAIRSFDLVELKQTSPVFGENDATNRRERVLMHYP